MIPIGKLSTAACILGVLVILTSCATRQTMEPQDTRPTFAIAIHGGARTVSPGAPEELQETYREALAEALAVGRDILAGGGTALDAVEAAVVVMEDNPLFNAGKGAVFSNRGLNELDASIMDGSNLQAGAVAGVLTPKNPIRAARKVMEETRHVLLAGPGADGFVAAMGLEQVDQDYFHTERRWNALQRALDREQSHHDAGGEREIYMGTVGAVALDSHGNLAAATSTGGLTNKRHGRVGDSPLIGAGTYANNATCAVSCTGQGELFIRHAVAHRLSSRMEYGGESLVEAMENVFTATLPDASGGAIAVDHMGNIVMGFNTPGMSRGAADSMGRFEVLLWDVD